MFVLLQQASVANRAIAMLLATALVLWGVGAHLTAEAANLTDVSNTLTDSDPGAVSNHTIEFVIPTGSNGIDATGEQIVVTVPTGFTGTSSLAFDDFDLAIDGTDQTLAGAASGATWGATVSGNDIIFETDTATVAALATVTIEIGTNATNQTTGDNQLVNPAATGSYQFNISIAAGQDTGKTEVAIIENVDVTASVDTNFDFTVTGFATAGGDVNGTSTTGTSTSTAIPFGTLTANQIETIAQRLNVTTNAINGYIVTVTADGQLDSSTGADIDGFIDGAYTDTPAAWVAPGGGTPDVNLENEWGHWGLTSTDATLSAGDEFASNLWVSASTTPREIMYHTGPSDGTTNHIGSTTIGYQIEITSLQEAADDYAAVLTYVATPTF